MSETPNAPMSVMLTSKDMQRSVAFYRDALGFELEAVWPDEKNPMWANMKLDGQSVMLGSPVPVEGAEGEDCEASDEAQHAVFKQDAENLLKGTAGAGVYIYVKTGDVDAYHKQVSAQGAAPKTQSTSQFYGIRDFIVEDPEGYKLIFYTPIKMAQCQSCGMPLKDAREGQMYCDYCTDEAGKLKPYEQVLEGTTVGYFIPQQKMERADAEKAAREHLAKMPAWQGRV